jgi:hypothetical protein
VLTVPIVKNFNGSKELFNVFNKMKINFYDFTEKINENILKEIKDSYILCKPTNADFFQKSSPKNKFFVLGETGDFKGLDKKENVLYMVTIKNDPNIKDLDELIKSFGYKNVHLDVSELLMKNENLVYEMLKKLKQAEYNDNMLRSILGRNFINMF